MNDLPLEIARPRALRPGARVALVSPAGPIGVERIELSADRCRSLGWEPIVFPAAASRHGFLAGTDAERLGDLQAAFDDPYIDAIWALRGGYGTLRILDRLSLDRQSRDPIPFIGFSDNTTIHVRQVRSGIVSFHGPHAGGPFPPDVDQWFRRILCEEAAPGPLPRIDGAVPPRTLVTGRAQGRLFGGNLALLAALCGSRDGVSAAGCILCLEDVGEPAYRLDRLLLQLHRAGLTEGIAGLALGRFTGAPNGEAAAVTDVVDAFARLLGVPAVGDLPFGHVDGNFLLPMGTRAVLDANDGSLSVTEPAVRSELRA